MRIAQCVGRYRRRRRRRNRPRRPIFASGPAYAPHGSDGVPSAGPVSEAARAIVFNGVPLLVSRGRLCGRRGVASAGPLARTARGPPARPARSGSSFPGSPVRSPRSSASSSSTTASRSAATSGSRSSRCSWRSVPALLLLARWGDRAFLIGGIGRTRAARGPRLRPRPRARGRRRALTGAQPCQRSGRGRQPAGAAGDRSARRRVRGVVVVSDDGRARRGRVRRARTAEAPWWRESNVDLRNEPSGIASAVFDAAPVTVYDVASSTLVEPAPRRARRRAEWRLDPDDRRGARDRRARAWPPPT